MLVSFTSHHSKLSCFFKGITLLLSLCVIVGSTSEVSAQRVALQNYLGFAPSASENSRLEASATLLQDVYSDHGVEVPVFDYTTYSLRRTMSGLTEQLLEDELESAVHASSPAAANGHYLALGAAMVSDESAYAKLVCTFNLPELEGCYDAGTQTALYMELAPLLAERVSPHQAYDLLARASETVSNFLNGRVSCCAANLTGCVSGIGYMSPEKVASDLMRRGWLPLMKFQHVEVMPGSARPLSEKSAATLSAQHSRMPLAERARRHAVQGYSVARLADSVAAPL